MKNLLNRRLFPLLSLLLLTLLLLLVGNSLLANSPSIEIESIEIISEVNTIQSDQIDRSTHNIAIISTINEQKIIASIKEIPQAIT